MQRQEPSDDERSLKTKELEPDLAIVGGGMAGSCCAITAARDGLDVVLVQDRPILGGNASSEVRLWILGATAHMSNNNRWAREGGVIDEILVENMYRNPEGNAEIFDTILLEKVTGEQNIELLLNTSAYDITKSEPDRIESIKAICSQNSTTYHIRAPYFCDASGDGIVGFQAGAAFRMGAEDSNEFDEKFAPDEEFGELLGHSLYFYTKDAGEPVEYVPPEFAHDDITDAVPRYRGFDTDKEGCQFWWIEYGGRLDTVHETEDIKWELWKVVYGVWDYIKNSGEFPEAETLTLEWVGKIPGKRESRRFEGDYMLTQNDVVDQNTFDDAVSFGGWALDLHPADGIYSEKPGCEQWHSRGVYQIPYRCMYSRNIDNLFLAGRILSASHVAFGSTRVMATCAHNAQAVGIAASLCNEHGLMPADLCEPERMEELQRQLLRTGQFIPGHCLDDPEDLAQDASVTASSQLELDRFPPNDKTRTLDDSWAMLIPVSPGPMPDVELPLHADEATTLEVELRTSERRGNFTPYVTLDQQTIRLDPSGPQNLTAEFDASFDEHRYVFVCLMKNELVQVQLSDRRVTGVLAVTNQYNPSVAKANMQDPEDDIGVERFEFWRPLRRPGGQNMAVSFDPSLDVFGPANVTNGVNRPRNSANAWVADPDDPDPALKLDWDEPRSIQRIVLSFDTDFDHPMESVLRGHPERAMPFCVKSYRIRDERGEVIAENADNHQTRNVIELDEPVDTSSLDLHIEATHGDSPASVFGVRCYEEGLV